MVTALVLTVAGFIIIFVQVQGYSQVGFPYISSTEMLHKNVKLLILNYVLPLSIYNIVQLHANIQITINML